LCRNLVALTMLRLILEYLIPVNMYMGLMPSNELLELYGLNLWSKISQAVKQGRLGTLNNLIQENQMLFLHRGTFLILESLKKYAFRNLLKKVYLCNKDLPGMTKAAQVSIHVISAAVKSFGELDLSQDSIECMIAGLIHERLALGYISHGNAVVFKRDNAFPKLVDLHGIGSLNGRMDVS